MTKLPEEFITETRRVMGEERFNRFIGAFEEEAPTSIRLNPRFIHGYRNDMQSSDSTSFLPACVKVPWCDEGYYLEGRPQFTFDPLFHAGCYYVQEASSMFVCHVLKHLVEEPVAMLDLCAAPGGKSTAAIATLPEGSTLVSNEPNPTRAQILLENITKWGYEGCTVTNSYPRDFRKARQRYDVILCDVPCSGEGMFRKDAQAIGEWSPQNVEKCWRLQREIVADAWECLNPGGLLIYSTCTFNIKENEENVRWIIKEYDAELLSIPTEAAWGITGSLLDGFDGPVYRFIPGITRGEGLFMAVMRKRGERNHGDRSRRNHGDRSRDSKQNHGPVPAIPGKGIKTISIDLPASDIRQEIPYSEAVRYLRGEALVLPADTPRGIVTLTYHGFPLGPAKNIGNRANNLYPKPWRIKTTHLPDQAPEVLRIEELKN